MLRNKKTVIAVIIGIIVIALVVMFGFVHFATKGDKILKNVYIDTVNVGGMTKEQANEAVASYMETVHDAKIKLKAEKQIDTLSVDKMGIQFKDAQAVKDAYNIGRNGNIFKNFFDVCKLKGSSEVVTLGASISKEQAEKVLEEHEKSLIAKTKNASLTRENGEFKIIDEVVGQEIVYDKSVRNIQNTISKKWDKKDVTISVSVEKENPKYTAKDMKDVKDVLGTYATSYGSSSYNRRQNIENGCSKIDGTVLYPGDTLSVYKMVAPFDAKSGYYKAPSYASGTVVQTYGGGICQVSTTLYDAVLRAELKVEERSNHSMTVHYVPLAADAAIAGTSKDLKFTNDTKTPVYIEGQASGGTIRFTIYGKETRAENRSIEFESKTISVKSPSTVETKDKNLEEGKRIVTQSGTTGYVAELWKVVYIDGKESKRTKVNTSSYRSTPRKVTVGTKKKEEKKEEKKEDKKDDSKKKESTTAAPKKPATTAVPKKPATTAAPKKTEPTTSEPSN